MEMKRKYCIYCSQYFNTANGDVVASAACFPNSQEKKDFFTQRSFLFALFGPRNLYKWDYCYYSSFVVSSNGRPGVLYCSTKSLYTIDELASLMYPHGLALFSLLLGRNLIFSFHSLPTCIPLLSFSSLILSLGTLSLAPSTYYCTLYHPCISNLITLFDS